MNTFEICICAAVRMDGGCIIRGQRHSDCLVAIGLRGWEHRRSIQGFVTSHNRFVDRAEAMLLQLAAGIPSAAPGGYRGAILFSEDLY